MEDDADEGMPQPQGSGFHTAVPRTGSRTRGRRTAGVRTGRSRPQTPVGGVTDSPVPHQSILKGFETRRRFVRSNRTDDCGSSAVQGARTPHWPVAYCRGRERQSRSKHRRSEKPGVERCNEGPSRRSQDVKCADLSCSPSQPPTSPFRLPGSLPQSSARRFP